MNTEEKNVSNVDEDNLEAEITVAGSINSFRRKFDKKSFFLDCALGIIFFAIGIWMIEATKTSPEPVSQPMLQSAARHISQVFPESTKDILIFIAGNLFLLLGVFCFFYGLRLVVRYIAQILKN